MCGKDRKGKARKKEGGGIEETVKEGGKVREKDEGGIEETEGGMEGDKLIDR